MLGAVGEIVDVYLPNDRETGRPRGFAFVQFGTEEAAADAIKKFDGYDLGGRALRVNLAEERRPRAFGGGGGAGGFGGGGGFGGYRPPPAPGEGGEFTSFGGDDADRRPSWGGGGAGGGRPGGPPPGRPKGSRRGLRGKKRSL